MHTVKRAFTTVSKRLQPGDSIAVEDCNSVEHFERLVALGYIEKAASAAPAAALDDPATV